MHNNMNKWSLISRTNPGTDRPEQLNNDKILARRRGGSSTEERKGRLALFITCRVSMLLDFGIKTMGAFLPLLFPL